MYSGLEGPDVLLQRMQDGVWTDELSAHPLITVLDAEKATRAQLQVVCPEQQAFPAGVAKEQLTLSSEEVCECDQLPVDRVDGGGNCSCLMS